VNDVEFKALVLRSLERIEQRLGLIGDAKAVRHAVAAERAERRAAIQRGADYLRKREARTC